MQARPAAPPKSKDAVLSLLKALDYLYARPDDKEDVIDVSSCGTHAASAAAAFEAAAASLPVCRDRLIASRMSTAPLQDLQAVGGDAPALLQGAPVPREQPLPLDLSNFDWQQSVLSGDQSGVPPGFEAWQFVSRTGNHYRRYWCPALRTWAQSPTEAWERHNAKAEANQRERSCVVTGLMVRKIVGL